MVWWLRLRATHGQGSTGSGVSRCAAASGVVLGPGVRLCVDAPRVFGVEMLMIMKRAEDIFLAAGLVCRYTDDMIPLNDATMAAVSFIV